MLEALFASRSDSDDNLSLIANDIIFNKEIWIPKHLLDVRLFYHWAITKVSSIRYFYVKDVELWYEHRSLMSV